MGKKFLVSCLEPSANLHFGEIFSRLSDCEFKGIFDEKFGKPFMKSSEFSAMGFVEVLPLYFKAKRAIKQMINLARGCDAVLLIDSPAFNLPLAKAIKKAGIKTPIIYYILPQVWAWKPRRVAVVERYCDYLASILPFDAKFYNRAIYVGHPLLDEIKVQKSFNLPNANENERLAFLPGSRKAEITRLMPIYREVARKIKGEKLLVVPPFLMGDLAKIYGDVSNFRVVNDTHEALLKSDFAFICSGTATLEAALIGTPFVLCYKARAIDVWLARRLVNIKYAGLANIMFDFMGKKPLHDELIQENVSVQNLLNAYNNCDREKFLKGCEILRGYLKHASAQNVVKILNKES